jgi:2-polyprenyl-3-methyl-5-hydroxy-6-metoxy-1,4-benzoquinol methylase
MADAFRSIDPEDGDTMLWVRVPGDWRRPDVNCGFEVYWRSSDGFGQIFPRPDAEDVTGFYDVDYYTHRDSAGARSAGTGLVGKLVRHLAWRADRGERAAEDWWARLLEGAGKRVLDIGCGNGRLLRRLQDLGHACVGVEPDASARRHALDMGLAVHDGTAEALPRELDGELFDCILMRHVLEHCLDPNHAIRSARVRLKPGGMLVVEVPNNDCLGRLYFGCSWLWLDAPRHLNFFTRASLSAIVASHGFEPVRIEFYGYNRQFSSHWRHRQREIAGILKQKDRNGDVSMLRYLARTAFGASERKYDSVRIIARNPHEKAEIL